MKPTVRDYLAITAALVAILLCGYGIGFLVGERTTKKRLEKVPIEAHGDWTGSTLERLTRELDLTSAQRSAIEPEVRQAAEEIRGSRGKAILEYRRALVALHERMLPHLDAGQRRQVEQSMRQLQSSLDKEGGSRENSSNEGRGGG